MEIQDIVGNLNIIIEKIIKSVEAQVYNIIDDILVIKPDIMDVEPIKNIFVQDKINGIIILSNSFIIFYFVYYVFSNLISLYNGNRVENIYKFIIKILIVSITVNCSFYICKQILEIFYLLTDVIDKIGVDITGKEIIFNNFKDIVLNIKDLQTNDILSLNGIVKGTISFGAIAILINFSIRYVTVIFLIIVSPLAIMCLSSDVTSGIFYTWGKMLLVSLLVQIVIKILIIIPMSYKDVNSLIFKIILVGTIYIIYKINNFVNELLVKIAVNKKGE